jgi:hypothetical protein
VHHPTGYSRAAHRAALRSIKTGATCGHPSARVVASVPGRAGWKAGKVSTSCWVMRCSVMDTFSGQRVRVGPLPRDLIALVSHYRPSGRSWRGVHVALRLEGKHLLDSLPCYS